MAFTAQSYGSTHPQPLRKSELSLAGHRAEYFVRAESVAMLKRIVYPCRAFFVRAHRVRRQAVLAPIVAPPQASAAGVSWRWPSNGIEPFGTSGPRRFEPASVSTPYLSIPGFFDLGITVDVPARALVIDNTHLDGFVTPRTRCRGPPPASISFHVLIEGARP